jgi:hypothetical protein
MAGKISELTALTGATASTVDLIETVDVSDTSMAASGTNKKMTLADLGLVIAVRSIVTYSGTSVTAALTDVYPAFLRFTGSNPTYTIPTNATVPIPVGSQIEGVGVATAMTLAGPGITFVKARTLVTVGAGSFWTAIKVATDSWDVAGDFV